LLHSLFLPLAAEKKRRRNEDTSRSGKKLTPSALPLFPTMPQPFHDIMIDNRLYVKVCNFVNFCFKTFLGIFNAKWGFSAQPQTFHAYNDFSPNHGSPAFVVLSNKEKAARAGLVRQRTPTQCVRDDFLGKHPSMPFCIGFLVDQHNG
jgi:hypothetical protein